MSGTARSGALSGVLTSPNLFLPLFIYTLALTGASGTNYKFTMLPLDGPLPNEPGIFVVAHAHRLHPDASKHDILFVSCTKNFSTVLKMHEKATCFEHHDANLVGVLIEQSERHCIQITQDLMANYDLPCNA